jgi:hypothetical protein
MADTVVNEYTYITAIVTAAEAWINHGFARHWNHLQKVPHICQISGRGYTDKSAWALRYTVPSAGSSVPAAGPVVTGCDHRPHTFVSAFVRPVDWQTDIRSV